MPKPLEGVRVLDFGRFLAGPFFSMMLADMGAEVIRVERPGGAEDRTTGVLAPNGENLSFPLFARNKKGITLNMGRDEVSRIVLRDLVRCSDVVTMNFSPTAVEKLGLSYKQLQAIKPDIIVAAISAFGFDGPYSHRVGFDPTAQLMSGAAHITGFPESPPTRSQAPWVDCSTGLYATIGTLLALRHRDHTGEGQMVDAALLQTAVSYMVPNFAQLEVLGLNRQRMGNRLPYTGPSDLFPCKDGWVYLSTISDPLWRRLLEAVGHEELLDDPELSNDQQRFEHRDRVDPKIAEWTGQRTMDKVMAVMEVARIPCGRYYTLEEVPRDSHVQARAMIEYVDMEYPGLERVPVPGIPVKLSKTPGRVERRAPRVGENNDEVYRHLLGYTEEKMEQLTAQGVI